MKKTAALTMAFIMCLSFTACTPKSQDVKNTEVMIRAIDTVTDASGEDIVTAESFYNKLSDEEKGQVSNYSTLQKARETYNSLIIYGQWSQYNTENGLTFTLKQDGTYTMSDGTSGTFEVMENEVQLVSDAGDEIIFAKEMNKNLLHLKTDTSDYIRQDLLTTDRYKIVSSSWYRFFDIGYHVHIEKDEFGIEKDYWNCYILTPLEEYADYVAPGTEVTLTMTYTTRQIATMYNSGEDNLLIVDEMTEPQPQTVTVTVTYDDLVNGECCGAGNEIVRGGTGKYQNYEYIYKTLDYLENAEVTSFEGFLYYYDQLK